MNLPTDDVNFITEETFDFGTGFPAESQESLLENDAEEALLGDTRRSERGAAMGIDVNSNNGSQQKTNEGVLKWSPLSAEKLVEIVKEANRLANQFEKCALKEKETAKRQGKEGRSCGDRSKLEKESMTKIRLLQEERAWKKSPRSPRRDTYFVLDSPNKALLPSVDLQVINENCAISKSAEVPFDNGPQTTSCRVESTSETEQITPDKPMRAKEGNLSTNSKQAAVKKQSVLARPSGLKLPSGINKKGNFHLLSSSKPYEYPSKKDLPLPPAGNLKQSRGMALNNPVNLSRESGRSTIMYSKPSKGKPPLMTERKMSSSTHLKPTTVTNIKMPPSTYRAVTTENNSRGQVSGKPIVPGSRLRPGSTVSVRAGTRMERGNSEVLKGKGSETQFQKTVAPTKHVNSSATTSTIQNRSLPKKVTLSNVKR
ncbi:proline/serine-rich coiled-coil protein 1 isoform X1 [Amblyraja radiata]|uniref:proline/serine-rich coiled-coil protein 1 isoform X1 n=1 Tax=Amblyraja radiata TaxID=386614 RepID=UPI001402047C|nr:proline/serine-rich coiled-coil protein 1 isoform X1 [Amblyraja radiata]XP_032898453.1 proline/serine-rich coiled-coil protein 1 isoform X1 [Amblyraja radiata]